jgi:tetratricopeptide (TPR) repeat protein
MSELRLETWTMPAADLGAENPLPPLRTSSDLHAVVTSADIPEDMQHNIAYGHVPNILPYTMQDNYNRRRRPRDFRVAVLENEFLRATFLLELGGRLWSLVHKPTGRELLSVNPVFQPANLALRNAWFSGGVEWNIGTIGHSPLTCSPVFAARVERDDGVPILRLYEWERIRGVPFQIDAYLPPDSQVLYVRVRITNPHSHAIAMYWWSNIAVPETSDTRVIVPADLAYRFGYKEEGLHTIPVPYHAGMDITYTTHHERAIDYFFHIPDHRRRWIAALDGSGTGLVQVSTDRLKGRKLFLWGTGTSGQRWQSWLSEPGHAYLEIQAGLARTQLEHLPMPAGAEWAWLEAYGLISADPQLVHSEGWAQAQQAVEVRLEALVSSTDLDAELRRGAQVADRPPVALLQRGTGWGVLERCRREIAGEAPFCSQGLVFDDESLGEAQAPWLMLLKQGRWPGAHPDVPPAGYLVQPEWCVLLEHSSSQNSTTDWLAWLHLGVMRHYAGDLEGARGAWLRSVERTPTAWALRNLAILAVQEQHFEEAADLIIRAYRLNSTLHPLIVEMGQTLLAAGQPQRWLDLLDEMPESERIAGRVRFLEAQAALAVGDLERVERFLANPPAIVDLREGERSLSHLWVEYQARRLSAVEHIPVDDALYERIRRDFPVPRDIDFAFS